MRGGDGKKRVHRIRSFLSPEGKDCKKSAGAHLGDRVCLQEHQFTGGLRQVAELGKQLPFQYRPCLNSLISGVPARHSLRQGPRLGLDVTLKVHAGPELRQNVL